LLVNRALFVIERSLYSDLSLERIAAYCSVSHFHPALADSPGSLQKPAAGFDRIEIGIDPVSPAPKICCAI
jgi:hypothetical protein